jgi:SAM-dependent methyltransferase
LTRYFSADELECLRGLRQEFLERESGSGETGDYWESDDELRLYDETFGARIGWKWDAVLDELVARGRLPAGPVVLDWGCGTAVATRRYLARASGVTRVHLVDHSPRARRVARELLAAEAPAVEVLDGAPEAPPDVLLVSHVLDELAPRAVAELDELVRSAGATLWVEPGSRASSRALGAVRARHVPALDVLAPCTHQAACGALAPGNDPWCHLFARAPQAVYTEGKWAEFGRELGLDLRSLPYSFLVLAQRGRFDLAGPAARQLGRPRLERGRAFLEVCDSEGLRALDFLQRTDKALYRACEDLAGTPLLFDATIEGRRIKSMTQRPR